MPRSYKVWVVCFGSGEVAVKRWLEWERVGEPNRYGWEHKGSERVRGSSVICEGIGIKKSADSEWIFYFVF